MTRHSRRLRFDAKQNCPVSKALAGTEIHSDGKAANTLDNCSRSPQGLVGSCPGGENPRNVAFQMWAA